MTVCRAVHGLAGLLGSSDESDSESESVAKSVSSRAINSASVFDVPGIFSEDITRKLREGERTQLQTSANAKAATSTTTTTTAATTAKTAATTTTTTTTTATRTTTTTTVQATTKTTKAAAAITTTGRLSPLRQNATTAVSAESLKNGGARQRPLRRSRRKRSYICLLESGDEEVIEIDDSDDGDNVKSHQHDGRRPSESADLIQNTPSAALSHRRTVNPADDKIAASRKSPSLATMKSTVITLDDSLLQDLDEDLHRSEKADDELDVEAICRVVVTPIGGGVAAPVVVRLAHDDRMEKVIAEASSAIGNRGLLMMGTGQNRREVYAEDTPTSLGLSTTCSNRMEFLPISSADRRACQLAADGFHLKIITGNRRQTKEVPCRPNENLGTVLRRYCAIMDMQRDAVVFKFDGEIIDDAETPAGLGIESGDLIEASPSAGVARTKDSSPPRPTMRTRRSTRKT